MLTPSKLAAPALAALACAVHLGADTASAAVDPWEEMAACAALGPKPPGSAAGRAQADRIAERFRASNLETSFEDFQIPVFIVNRTSIRTLGAGARDVAGETFAYGGTGRAQAEVVDVGVGRPPDYAGKDVRGKIVMVRRDTAFHRSSQLSEVTTRGGVAMVYVSGSPNNLVQTGTVRFAQSMPATIPAVTVGADDGQALRQQIESGGLTMAVEVDAERQNGVGRNVIGVRRGTTHPGKVIVVGGHYDNWHAGAVDNCSAIGSMLTMADAVKNVPLAYTVVFGAWDAEEVGLTGSYDYVARHPEVIANTVFNENLEMTAAGANNFNLRFGTTGPAMLAAAQVSGLANGYLAVDIPAVAVRQISGGIIPTDLQPFYSSGVQGLSTFTETPYYHTREDARDKVDRAALARVTAYLEDLLVNAQAIPPAGWGAREVPKLTVTAPRSAVPGRPVTVRIHLDDALGNPLPGQTVSLRANQKDHWSVAEGVAKDLGNGDYEWTIPAGTTEADITRVTATSSRVQDIAEGYATIDQRGGGILAPAKVCTSRRRFRIHVSAPKNAGRIRKITARTTAGKTTVVGRRAVDVDLRGTPKRTVKVTVAARTTRGGTIRQSRTYRTCVSRRALRLAVGAVAH